MIYSTLRRFITVIAVLGSMLEIPESGYCSSKHNATHKKIKSEESAKIDSQSKGKKEKIPYDVVHILKDDYFPHWLPLRF